MRENKSLFSAGGRWPLGCFYDCRYEIYPRQYKLSGISSELAMIDRDYKIAVVIPCYKVKRHILNVIKNMGPEVSHIYVVDDCCPDGQAHS